MRCLNFSLVEDFNINQHSLKHVESPHKHLEVLNNVVCKTDLITCDCFTTENFQLVLRTLPAIITANNKVHKYSKNSGPWNFWNFVVIRRGLDGARLLFVTPTVRCYVCVKTVMVAVLCRQCMSQTNRVVSIKVWSSVFWLSFF